MIKFTDFLPVPEPGLTKVKFNMRAGDGGGEAWDLLVDDHEEWLNLSRYRTKQTNNNMGGSRYLLSFAQYYPYGPQYFIFGGFFEVTPLVPELLNNHGYRLTPLPLHAEYIKRLIIKLDRQTDDEHAQDPDPGRFSPHLKPHILNSMRWAEINVTPEVPGPPQTSASVWSARASSITDERPA